MGTQRRKRGEINLPWALIRAHHPIPRQGYGASLPPPLPHFVTGAAQPRVPDRQGQESMEPPDVVRDSAEHVVAEAAAGARGKLGCPREVCRLV